MIEKKIVMEDKIEEDESESGSIDEASNNEVRRKERVPFE